MSSEIISNETLSLLKSDLGSRYALPTLENSSNTGSRRLALRKRTVSAVPESVNLSSYNSAFLSGLFADVAKVSDIPSDDCIVSSDSQSNFGNDILPESQRSNKRGRVTCVESLTRIKRSRKSFTGLRTLNDCKKAPAKCSVDGLNSLHYQLNELGGNLINTSSASLSDIGTNAFPKISAFVSDLSCNKDLTRKDDNALSIVENPLKESYGWFVVMDDCENQPDYVDPYSTATADLAFTASTAPKRNKLHEEVEWAKAADTVDDVLGDFF